jgi:hypothetical protein
MRKIEYGTRKMPLKKRFILSLSKGAGRHAQGWGWDAIPQWDLRLGTVYDCAGLGGMLRFGRNLRVDYGPPHIDLNPGGRGS